MPRDLETVVLKAIARDPAHPYQTPAEMAEDLKRFVEDRPIRARRVSETEKLLRWCRRNKGLAASLAVIALLTFSVAVGSTVAALYFQGQEQTQKALAAKNLTLAEQREAASRLAEKRADQVQQNLYWAELSPCSVLQRRATSGSRELALTPLARWQNGPRRQFWRMQARTPLQPTWTDVTSPSHRSPKVSQL